MRPLFRLCLILFLLFAEQNIVAQSPPFFSYNTENGAPSNEMYWVHQDKDGYMWIGCDAGLYRFNGVRYEHFTAPELTARSATGIIQSKATGRIYAYNFNRQFFYVENDQLKVVKGWDRPVNGLADDGKGNIWITSGEGLFALNERDQTIKKYSSEHHVSGSNNITFTAHGISTTDDAICYQNGNKVFRLKNNKETFFILDGKFASIQLLISRFSVYPWIISISGNEIFRYENGRYSAYTDQNLIQSLLDKKINCVFETTDGKLWVGTYTGLICHDPFSHQTEIFHPQFSFSYGTVDKEGNYWFSTLHNGLIRIPNMEIRSWRSTDEKGSVEQFTHVCTDSKNVFLGGTNGFISVLKKGSSELQKFSHLPLSDLGALYFDPIDECIYLNKTSQLYRFKEGKFNLINANSRTVKSMLHIPGGYFILSSQGLFFTHSIKEPIEEGNMIHFDWYRDIAPSPFSSSYFTASNSGLQELVPAGKTYKLGKKFLAGKQVISVTTDPIRKKIFFYSFDGGLYSIDKHNVITKVRQWDSDIRIIQVRYHDKRIFMASNKGILVYDPETDTQVLFNRFNGLSSNNIRSITFIGRECWAAGESVQQIPLSLFEKEFVKAEIRTRKILVNGQTVVPGKLIEMSYSDKLSLIADGICYRSNGTFQFAYRISGINNSWIKVPGTVDKIDFASLPTGEITIELKLIDHEGRDSANVLRYQLYVSPPFWQRWWFYVLITLATLSLAFGIFRLRLKAIRKKQALELRRLKLENELRLTQQNALKAQMNPHFLFNVLNSIKGYIYENDKRNAAKYLSEFSSLVRKVLELSSVPTVSLDQEIEALDLYIDLEAMLLQSDFEYEVKVDENVDASGIHIPALLLQPYVENAFKHGLRHKHGPKKLAIRIHFNEKEELLTVEITDNGIGRKASAVINADNRGEHKSFATSAMEKRIELLNHERKDVVGVEIRDNFEGGEATGTTIIIRIHV